MAPPNAKVSAAERASKTRRAALLRGRRSSHLLAQAYAARMLPEGVRRRAARLCGREQVYKSLRVLPTPRGGRFRLHALAGTGIRSPMCACVC